jgi:hypothetical protein
MRFGKSARGSPGRAKKWIFPVIFPVLRENRTAGEARFWLKVTLLQ